MKPTCRRDFLKIAAAGLALGSAASHEALAAEKGKTVSADPTTQPIIDTHQHLWDLSKFRLPWTDTNPPMKRSFLLSDYDAATKGLNVQKTIYMEVDLVPEQKVKEAEFVIETCKQGGRMVGGVIGGEPGTPGFHDYITKYKGSPYIKGVRQCLHPPTVPAGTCLKPEFIKNVQLLGELGMSYDIVIRPAELADAEKLVAACPHTRFILDHCGNGDVQAKPEDRAQWAKGVAAIAKHKHVVCKVSGIVASAKPGEWKAEDLAPIVKHVIHSFGPDRVVFGGDWPVCTLAATYHTWFDALNVILADMGASAGDRQKLFYDNAHRQYGLKG